MALLDVYMQLWRFGEALVLLAMMMSAHAGVLKADPNLTKWLRANELAARLGRDEAVGAKGEGGLSREERAAMVRELETLVAEGGLDGPYFSRTQRRQVGVGE
jgi:hypothetical protein